MLKIGIDARFFGSAGKGLGRYTQKLIEKLEKIDQKNQYYIFLRKENFSEYQPENPNFKKVLADYRWYGFSEQIFFPFLLYRHKLDIVHFPHFNVPIFYWGKIVVTIHDLILLHFPTVKNTTLNPIFYKVKFLAYKLTIGFAIRRAKKIITVSQFTKKDILSNYNITESKISVTYEACENFCFFSSKKRQDILEKYGIIKPYLLYVGNAYPHKNLEMLVMAFADRDEGLEKYSLVLVGRDDYFYSRIKKFVSDKGAEKIIFPGFVSDADLDEVYRNATVYVFPSLYEGFGLPPLEAMSKGVPVLSSDHECMREILGNSAMFCNARDKEEFKKSIEEIITNEKSRDDLINKGYRRVAVFSWEKMAGEILNIYEGLK